MRLVDHASNAIRRGFRRAAVFFNLGAAALGVLTLWAPAPARGQNSSVSVTVNVSSNRRPISPLIYGLNYAGLSDLSALNSPLHRLGGNNLTRYNWKLNADNKGADWFFQSIADGDPSPSGRADAFVAGNKAAGTQSMLTIPMIGWVAQVNIDRSKRWSFSVAKYGQQQVTDWQWAPDAGNGIKPDGSLITGNDPQDASAPADTAFMAEWVRHLVGTFGTAANGGTSYYLLDNEPSLWHSTHRDVFPVGLNMDDAWTRMRNYALAVKGADSSAQVCGPEEWGWSGFLLSGFDQQWGSRNGWSNLPDRAAHGNKDYVPWLLSQFRQDESARGKRLLDVLTLHYYPQGGEFSNETSEAMQLRRNRSTRALWDPSYVDESWIGQPVQLVPRMKGWVAQYYPGTRIGLTEYNWGADGHMSGATAQADVLGILGREGMDIATRWTTPAPQTPTYKAFQLYRNYDGAGSSFGDTSVSCQVPDPDTLSAFAAQDSSSGNLTVMVINKRLPGETPVSTPVNLSLSGFSPSGSAQVYQLTGENVIRRLGDVPLSGTRLALTLPPQSITLVIVPAEAAAETRLLWNHVDGRARLWTLADATAALETGKEFGPFAGWAVRATAIGPDNKARLLWNHVDGRASLWNLDAANAFESGVEFGPFPGWTIHSLAVGADGKTRLLWTGSNGRVSLWTLSATGAFESGYEYGPYNGWSVRALAVGADNKPRLLWSHTTGHISVWTLSVTGALIENGYEAGPFAGWSVAHLAVGKDNKARLLWNAAATGRASVWTLNAAGSALESGYEYGPFAGWSAGALAGGADGKTRLLWKNTDGRASVWVLSPTTNAFENGTEYGPFSGWKPATITQ